jgi:hypothetical protein
MCVATVKRDRFAGEQRAIYFKDPRYTVMPQGQFPTGCPEEASTLLPMAETGRLIRPDATLGRDELYLAVGRNV